MPTMSSDPRAPSVYLRAAQSIIGNLTLRILGNGLRLENGKPWPLFESLLLLLKFCSVSWCYIQVSLYSLLSIWGTTLMNPALIEIAIKYGTRQLFVFCGTHIKFSVRYHKYRHCGYDTLGFLSLICPCTYDFRTLIWDVWPQMGNCFCSIVWYCVTETDFNLRSSTSLICSMRPSTWLVHLRRTQGLWLLAVSLVSTSSHLYIDNWTPLLTTHVIAGCAAGPATAISGGTVDDLFSERERGLAMALYVIMPFIGAYTQSLFVSMLIKYDLIRFHRWCVYLLCYLIFNFIFIDFVGPISGGILYNVLASNIFSSSRAPHVA